MKKLRVKRIFHHRPGNILVALCAIIVLFVIIIQSVHLDGTDLTSTSLGVGTPDESLSIFGGLSFFKSQDDGNTVPFAKTSGVPQDNTEPDYDPKKEEIKLKIIDEYERKSDKEKSRVHEAHAFYEKVFDIIIQGAPNFPSMKYNDEEKIYHARYIVLEESSKPFDEEFLYKFLKLDNTELNDMIRAHRWVKESLPERALDGIYSGDGIVYVGGGEFNWLTLLSIKSLRSLGTTLPIEVLIPTFEEFEPDFCSRVLPAFNAKCIFLPTALLAPNSESAVSKMQFKGFQYKSLAILVLSFQNVLLLDSDNIPIHSPLPLFTSEPFKSKGLIVWPDFWRRATSPFFYKIAGMKVTDEYAPRYNEHTGRYEEVKDHGKIKDLKGVPLHQRKGSIPDPTSESGQLMINKKTHMKALLLALYYNIYGPSHFYPLFSQGSDGEGDKETFLAATCSLKKPFYQVGRFLHAFGYMKSGEFVGTGMGQFDPIEDYEYSVLMRKKMLSRSVEDQEMMVRKETLLQKGPRIFFVHSNFPKLNPWALKSNEKIFNDNGDRIRLYGLGMRRMTGVDFETLQWTNMKFLLCDLNISLKTFEEVGQSELCKEINEHLNFLKSTISTLE